MPYDTQDSGKTRRNELAYIPLGIRAAFDWRLPTTEEFREYKNEYMRSQFVKGSDKAKDFDFQQGLRLVVGIRENDWSAAGKPVSSNPKSPDYREDWKDVLARIDVAKIMIAGLADAIFGGVFDRGEVVEESVPFPKSSGGSPQIATPSVGENASPEQATAKSA